MLNVHLENISLGNMGIVLTDMNGKMVQAQDHFLYDNSFETQLDMSSLPTGTYLLVIANEFHHLTRKIVKK
ncbi:MAG: T9SS type A sorting domain-containing protein [Sphingobacteriales bacterium]|nr:T9SS type A sorting domain-containing protein [Sphingobacteriales bacterium]